MFLHFPFCINECGDIRASVCRYPGMNNICVVNLSPCIKVLHNNMEEKKVGGSTINWGRHKFNEAFIQGSLKVEKFTPSFGPVCFNAEISETEPNNVICSGLFQEQYCGD
ncbi:hypothetical protein GOODEAATRI_033926 [Goodea atripinnis]|uniref:Uncharacterized protein n=1 Tax=Goodea atripinnis TaxID=208336 RepID=A0ABV0Q415_9TELE